jgi:photosystem II stability/assembly factor-like uncharacterized protein
MNKKTIVFGLIAISLVAVGSTKVFSSDHPSATSTKTLAAKTLIPATEITHGHGMALDAKDPSKLYIATHHGLYVLQDDKKLYQVGDNHNDYMGFSTDAHNSNVFFSSGHPEAGGNIGFQKSEDGGFNWKQVSTGLNGPVDFHALSVSPVDSNLAFGWFKGDLQRSTDGGKTWKAFNTGFPVSSLTADPKDVKLLYATTPAHAGLMVSHNMGEAWEPLSTDLEGGIVSAVAVNPNDTSKLLAFSEKLGGLGMSSDSGKTWQKVDETFSGEEVLYIAISHSDPATVYALTHTNSVYKSLDGGDTWTKIR